ncbi:MAG TPA: hypothetical protein VIY29_28890 [Ktedonobacteraceae bacterium]
MGFWSAHTLDPIEHMQRREMSYDAYKVLYVRRPRPKEAWRTVIWESRQPYEVLRHNCSDVVFDILRAYGSGELLDPVEEPAPIDWYDALPGRSYLIADHPTIQLHLHQMSKRTFDERDHAHNSRACTGNSTSLVHAGLADLARSGWHAEEDEQRYAHAFRRDKKTCDGATQSLPTGANTRSLTMWWTYKTINTNSSFSCDEFRQEQ